MYLSLPMYLSISKYVSIYNCVPSSYQWYICTYMPFVLSISTYVPSSWTLIYLYYGIPRFTKISPIWNNYNSFWQFTWWCFWYLVNIWAYLCKLFLLLDQLSSFQMQNYCTNNLAIRSDKTHTTTNLLRDCRDRIFIFSATIQFTPVANLINNLRS